MSGGLDKDDTVSEHAGNVDTHRPFGGPDQGPATMDDVIARLSREVLRDQRLRALAPESELERLVETSVRLLWRESRVKAFVPLLAMRRVREGLGIAAQLENEQRDESA
jgi:hypothetical protein